MEFEWNTSKAETNEQKHGVSFEFAVRVFADDDRIERLDTESSHLEERWCTIGLIEGIEIYVVYTLRDEGIRLISARKANRHKEPTTGTVKFELDSRNPQKMNAEQMKRLSALKDDEIDYSDAPASPKQAVWSRPGALIPAGNKRQITVRLDADVLEFFKKTGTRYQSRINAALREYMNAQGKAS